MAEDETRKKKETKEVSPRDGSREEAVRRILDKLEKQLIDGELKGTIADYLKLIQVGKEMAEMRPREIEITWVNSLREESGK